MRGRKGKVVGQDAGGKQAVDNSVTQTCVVCSVDEDARLRYISGALEGLMTPDEKVAHLFALARSTSFTSERNTAVGLARTPFNKYRLIDTRLRWDLLRALGLEAGPEPACSRAASPDGTSEGEDWAAWRERMAAEQAEQERWTRAWMKRAQRRQRAGPARPQPRASAPKTGTQRRRWDWPLSD